MAMGTRSGVTSRGGVGVARPPPAVLKTVRPKLFRRASLTSWGKDNLGMTRAAASVNLKELMLTVQQQKYEDRDKAAQREMSRTASYEGEESIRQRNERRAKLLARSGHKKNFLINWERECRGKWNANQAAMCRYERRLLNYEFAVKESAAARQRMSKARHTKEETEGIRWFEKNLDKLGLDPEGDTRGSGSGTGGGVNLPDKETRATFRSRILRAVVDQKFVPSSNAEAMVELRFRGNAGRRGRQERKHRRIKTEVDRRRAKVETDAQRAADEHLKSMLKKGRERRDFASAYWERQHAREDKMQSEKERFAKMAADQQAAFNTVFNARAAHARERYLACSTERGAKSQALRAKLNIHQERKHRRVEVMCTQVAHKIADLAVVASETRAHQGGVPLPPTTWTHLKQWFCSSNPFFSEEPPQEPPQKPRNAALKAKTLLESQNLERCEGQWGPQRVELTLAPPQRSPLFEALSTARDLVGGLGNGPREAPTYGHGKNYGEGRGISVRMAILGQRDGLDNVCAELETWTSLYVCSMDAALECAMEVGAELSASDGKSGKRRKGSFSGNKGSGSGRKSSAEDSTSGNGTADLDAAEAEKSAREAKEAVSRRAFDKEAREEDVAGFRDAAAAYYALRTHPKKAAAPVPVATTINILTKHLSCRAPRGRGWLLVGYPSTLLESKMLENALSGYTDEEVAAELAGGKTSKPDVKKKNGSLVPAQGELRVPPKSGLDAVLNLTKLRTAKRTGQTRGPAGQAVPNGKEINTSSEERVPLKEEDAGSEDRSSVKAEKDEPDNSQSRNARMEWWGSFLGGHVACDVPNESNDERLLETLFLLVNAAQNRKDKYEVSLKEEALERETLENGAAQLLENEAADCNVDIKTHETGVVHGAPPVDRPSPLMIPLTASLEDLRDQRRANMSHATRIRVEALTGERELDVEGVRSAVAQTEKQLESQAAVATGGASIPLSLMEALQNLEAGCSASSVVEWATAAEFSFSMGLRTADNGWTAACLRLEDEIADWLARRDVIDSARQRYGQTRGAIGGDGGSCTHPGSAAPPGGGDRVWEALNEFELEAGNVVDNRHASAEATIRDINNEADGRVLAWAENAALVAADLCAAEYHNHNKTIENLQILDGLFGLDEDCSSTLEAARETAQAAMDALANEMSAASDGRQLGTGGGALKEAVGRAVQEILPRAQRSSSAHGDHEIGGILSIGDPLACVQAASKEATVFEAQSDAGGSANNQPTSGELGPRLLRKMNAGNGDDAKEEHGGALATAIWLSRQIYVCRLRGVLARLVRAIGLCEARVSLTRAALRRLKRRRVHLEHEGVSAATLVVRRALDECDHSFIENMLRNGIPLVVEDDETFAADPWVALPWGMNGLGLHHIVDLAAILQSSFGAGAGEARGVVSATDLAHVVRAWANSVVTEDSATGTNEDVPLAWTGEASGYVETLCRAMGFGTTGDEVPWRRLIHCLLLGHLSSLPTLDDLRSMRRAFSLKDSSASRLSTGALVSRPSSGKGVIVGTQTSAVPEQTPTLRIAQRHLSGIRLWFEEEEEEEDEEEDGTRGKEAEEQSRRGAACTCGTLASTIKTVYTEAWGEDDGRLGGLDLLLTLCAAPDSRAPEITSIGADAANGGDTGIPFSLGFFRAFTMLAETPSSATGHNTTASNQQAVSTATATTTAAAAAAAPFSSTDDLSKGAAIDSVANLVDGHPSHSPRDHDGGDPCVTLQHLRAILEHGGGMPIADISNVCKLLSNAKERRRHRQRKRRRLQLDTPASTANKGPNAEVDRTAQGGNEAVDGAEGNKPADQAQVAGGPAEREAQVASTAGRTGLQDNGVRVPAGAFVESEGRNNTTHNVRGNSAEGRKVASETAREDPIMVSFAEVCSCEAVRAWVRKGAYTLPSFEVTSGRGEIRDT